MNSYTIKTSWLIAVALTGAGLAGCHPKTLAQAKRDTFGGGVHVSTVSPTRGPVAVVDRLDCPAEVGGLSRTAQAADGRSCDYASPRGEVTLSRVDAPAGDAGGAAALAPLRAAADALLPHQAEHATITVVSEVGTYGKKTTRVDMPFMHVEDDGGRSKVKMMGMTFNSDKTSRSVTTGDKALRTTVRSDDDAAPARPGSGRDLIYLLAGDPGSAQGWHAVGYLARADARGAVVAAAFRYRDGKHIDADADGVTRSDPDLRALLDLNAPVNPSATAPAS